MDGKTNRDRLSYKTKGARRSEELWEGEANAIYKKVSLFQEFYIEFFGTFVPGFVFVSFACILLLVFFYFVHGEGLFGSETIQHINPWGVFGFITVFSYVVGAILYRKEPNVPDSIAAFRQWRSTPPEERSRLAVQFPDTADTCRKISENGNSEKKVPICQKIRNAWVNFWNRALFHFSSENFVRKQKCCTEFPYPYLRQYLLKRGMVHLLSFVPWCEHCKEATGRLNERSKVSINVLKTRIKCEGDANQILDLFRLEGHIRMLTSLWHVLRYLYRINWVLIGVVALLLWWSGGHFALALGVNSQEIPLAWFWFFSAAVGGFFFWGKRGIEHTIHYVRSREVVIVLEQAYMVDRRRMESGRDSWFEDFRERNEAFIENAKKSCHGSCDKQYQERCRQSR